MDKKIAKIIFSKIKENFNYSMTHKYYTLDENFKLVNKNINFVFEKIYDICVTGENIEEKIKTLTKYNYYKYTLKSMYKGKIDEIKLAKMIYNKSVGLDSAIYTMYIKDKNKLFKFLDIITNNFSDLHKYKLKYLKLLLDITKYIEDEKKNSINEYDKMIISNFCQFYQNSNLITKE